MSNDVTKAAAAGVTSFGALSPTEVCGERVHIDREARAMLKLQRPCVVWFTGLPGAGKSTIAGAVEQLLVDLGDTRISWTATWSVSA